MRCAVDTSGDEVRVTLRGDLDERAGLEGIVRAGGRNVVIDLEGVARINSAGVHRWVQLLEQLVEDRRVTLTRCSTAFVSQALMIPNAIAGAIVESLHASYSCQTCEAAEDVLLRCGEATPLGRRCTACGGSMEADTSPALLTSLLFRRGA